MRRLLDAKPIVEVGDESPPRLALDGLRAPGVGDSREFGLIRSIGGSNPPIGPILSYGPPIGARRFGPRGRGGAFDAVFTAALG